MGFLDLFKAPDINQGIREYRETQNAVLLDVRTPQEYQEGYIPNSKNIPLQLLENISTIAEDKNTPLFIYCHSGVRSQQAVAVLQHMGYTKVKDIGGIIDYSGKVEKR